MSIRCLGDRVRLPAVVLPPTDTTYSYTFDGTNGAAPPAAWAAAVGVYSDAAYPTTASTIQSNRMRIPSGSTSAWSGGGSRFLGNRDKPQGDSTTGAPPIASNGTYVFRYNLLNLSEQYPSIGFRLRSADLWPSGGGQNLFRNGGYSLVLGPAKNSIDLVQNYNSATLATIAYTFSSNLMWVKLKLDRKRLSFKFWAQSASEPTAWTYDVDNIITDESDGNIGFSVFNGPAAEQKYVEIDDFTWTTPILSLGTDRVSAPTTEKTGFTRVYTENFDDVAPAGTGSTSFLDVYSTRVQPYDEVSPKYQQRALLSAHDGVMDVGMNGTQGAAWVYGSAAIANSFIGGRFSMRAKTIGAFNNGPAWMIWPSNNAWVEGEIDFPESVSGNGGTQGFQDAPYIHHHTMNTDHPNDQSAAQDIPLGVSWRDWHVYTAEWYAPGQTPSELVTSTSSLSYDAVAARGLAFQKKVTDWSNANVQPDGRKPKILFGEVGIPSNLATEGGKYDARYDTVLQAWLEGAKAANAPFQVWGSAEWRMDLRAYASNSGTSGDLAVASNVATVLEKYLPYSSKNGVNLSGGEFGVSPSGMSTVPGVLGTDYYYPSDNDISFLSGRGIKTVRLPFAWERAQRSIGSALDTTFVTNITRILAKASSLGMTVILDCHNYGKYTPSTGAAPYKLGQTITATNGITSMNAAFTDLWTKIATQWGTHAGLNGYGLMNEPVGLSADSNGNDTGSGLWRTASAATALALYNITGTTKNIYVAGYFYSTASQWTDYNGNTPWLYDYPPGKSSALSYEPNVFFEAHMYFDDPDGGIYTVTYANNLTRATNAGYASGSIPLTTNDPGLVIYYVDNNEVYRTKTDIPKTNHRFMAQVGEYGQPGSMYIDYVTMATKD